jgi:hypothetical protein
MNQAWLLLAATALLVTPSRAQTQSAQSQTEITIPEFRQALADYGAFIDGLKGTELKRHFEEAPDYILAKLYTGVSNGRQLQSAIAVLKKSVAERALIEPGAKSRALPQMSPASPPTPSAKDGDCFPGLIVDDALGALCTPAYPSGAGWEKLVAALIPPGALTESNGDINTVSSQQCDVNVESNLSLATSVLQGTVEVASAVCSALPPGASNACFVIAADVAVGGAVTQGLFSDCQSRDGNVNSAQIQASFHNTVTIYNSLKAWPRMFPR